MLKFNLHQQNIVLSINYLNTSYVKVQLTFYVIIPHALHYLNTSYVKVQLKKIKKKKGKKEKFKYILC